MAGEGDAPQAVWWLYTSNRTFNDIANALLVEVDRPGLNMTRGSASVDYCEANYELDPGLAEAISTFGALACVSYSLTGLAVAYSHGLEYRVTLIWAIGAWWGLGAALMHATLSAFGQFAQEVAMIALVLRISIEMAVFSIENSA